MSDLKYEIHRSSILAAIKSTDISGFSLRDWGAALSYVFDDEISFHSENDIVSFLQSKEEK